MYKKLRRILGFGLLGVMLMTAVPTLANAQSRGSRKGGKKGGGRSGRKQSPKGGRGGSSN
jgi:hypothetical protein